jgi:L-ascorbate metabolism protein UlaG (beta-lactamase superfamily)
MEEIDGIDLIFLPGGSENSMDLKNALDLAATLEPGIIIPMLYESMESLQKEGIEGEIVKSAKIGKSSIPEEGKMVVILEKNN